jgi:hypothetical protein
MTAIGIVIAFAVLVAPAIIFVGWLQERIERRSKRRGAG